MEAAVTKVPPWCGQAQHGELQVTGFGDCAVFEKRGEEQMRFAVPTYAEGLDLVAEVGNKGSAVWCEEVAGAAFAWGPGFGRLTIPVVDAQVTAAEIVGAAAASGPGFGLLTIPAVAVECEEELLRIAAPTFAEGVDLVAEVGNKGSAVWCEGAGGAASVCGTGLGLLTIPVDAAQVFAAEGFGAAAARDPGFGLLTIPVVTVEVEGVFAGTAECAVFFECEEELLRSEAPTSAEGLDLVAEVGNRGSAAWCVEADGAAFVGGPGCGPRG